MHYTETETLAPSLRIFPRIAASKTSNRPVRAKRLRRARTMTSETSESGDDRRNQVRARLLSMILNNERARRHEHRPNAS